MQGISTVRTRPWQSRPDVNLVHIIWRKESRLFPIQMKIWILSGQNSFFPRFVQSLDSRLNSNKNQEFVLARLNEIFVWISSGRVWIQKITSVRRKPDFYFDQNFPTLFWTPNYLNLLSANRMHSMSTRNHYLSGTISFNHTFTFFNGKSIYLKFIQKQFVDLLQVSSRVACTTVDTFQDQS